MASLRSRLARPATAVVLSALLTQISAAQAAAPCTSLCLQQMACPNGGDTTLHGTVYAPNGVDPIPNVTVYIPNAAVPALAPGVSCPAPGSTIPGSPLVGTYTAADGTFTLSNVPVGANIPLVIVAGKWRRQLVIPATTACTVTQFDGRFPKNQSEGDIPKFAISTGNQDSVECVLRKVGIDDAEFTNPSGSGRIHLYTAKGAPGAQIDSSTPNADALMGNLANLSTYDILMLPCEGRAFTETPAQLANFTSYANGGGRVYASHYAYEWMYHNPPFDSVVAWANNPSEPDGLGYVNPTFSGGATLTTWLQLVGASTTPGQIQLDTIRHDFNSIAPATQPWINYGSSSGPPVQITFDAPVGATQQCGRVLFNDYHVENPTARAGSSGNFPTECSDATITPQEKLLEYSLFDLGNDGGPASLTPTTADFGSEAVNFQSASQTFTVRNNSIFNAPVKAPTTGDFVVTGNTCSTLTSFASCTFTVAFQPTALGPRTGTVNLSSNGTLLAAALTGTGTPALTLATAALDFGSTDVGTTITKTLTVNNVAPGPVTLPTLAASGDFTLASACGAIPAGGSCTLTLKFTPSTSGPRTATLGLLTPDAAYTGLNAKLTGNGLDFAVSLEPASGTIVAGLNQVTSMVVSPMAGFSAPVTQSCSTDVAGTTCTVATATVAPAAEMKTVVTITTTSQYTLPGYSGMPLGWLSLVPLGAGAALWWTRRKSTMLLRLALWLVMAATMMAPLGGCSGKIPDKNPVFTAPGTYNITMTATDGVLTHSATYSLTVKSH